MYHHAASSHLPRKYRARGGAMRSIEITYPATVAIVARPFPVQEQCKANAVTICRRRVRIESETKTLLEQQDDERRARRSEPGTRIAKCLLLCIADKKFANESSRHIPSAYLARIFRENPASHSAAARATQEPTHPQRLPGREPTFVRGPAVRRLGDVRGGIRGDLGSGFS